MAVDDRDPKFERALARELRAESAHAGCPDAETLAAYHERALSLEEMAHWKEHISGCAACQEALSLVEVTEKALAEDWEQQGIPMLEAAVERPVAARIIARKGEDLAAGASPANTAPVVMAKRRRPKLAKWAIPLGALAAAVLIGIGIYQQRALQSPASKNIQVAENRPQAAPAPSRDEADSYSAVPADRNAQRAQQAQLDDKTMRKESEALPKTREESKLAPPAASADALRKDTGEAKKQGAGNLVGGVAGRATATPAPALPPPPAPNTPARTEIPNAITETVEVSAAPPVTPSTQPAPTATGSGSGAGKGARLEDQKQATADRAKSSPQQETAQLSTNAMMMSKQGVSSQSVEISGESSGVIVTPDNKEWWRLTADGAVELTTDSGKKWKSVSTGAGAQLTAGSAPSGKVCWIAGKAGTLVLTTDRGGHWKKLTTPISGDLGGVHASDAKHATIWDATNRQSFETSDGGETWKPAANE
jgi:hypothetical protein